MKFCIPLAFVTLSRQARYIIQWISYETTNLLRAVREFKFQSFYHFVAVATKFSDSKFWFPLVRSHIFFAKTTYTYLKVGLQN